MSNVKSGRLALLVGGGPAPGINGVISAVTIEAVEGALSHHRCRDGGPVPERGGPGVRVSQGWVSRLVARHRAAIG